MRDLRQVCSKSVSVLIRLGSTYAYTQVVRIRPNDMDARKKLKECEGALRRIKFEEAISVADEVVITSDLVSSEDVKNIDLGE